MAFGSQLVGKEETIHALLLEGYQLLVLDAEGMGWSKRRGIESLSFSDFISAEGRRRIRGRADSLAHRFSSSDAFKSCGVDWLLFDREALQWFWLEVATAFEYLSAFSNHGITEVILLSAAEEVGLYYYPSDAAPLIWRSQNSISVGFLHPPRRGGERNIAGTRSGWARQTARRVLRRSHSAPPSRSVALVLNLHEHFRLSSIIEKLVQQIPHALTLVLREAGPADARDLSGRWGVEVLLEPLPDRKPQTLAPLADSIRVLQSQANDPDVELCLHALRRHFRLLTEERWPRLLSSMRAWETYWDSSEAEVVITSSLGDAENRVVSLAANRAGRQTLTVPHAEDVGVGPNLDVDVLGCATLYQQRVYELAGAARSKIALTADVRLEEEYPALSFPGEDLAGFRILVLTLPVSYPHLAHQYLDPSSQLEALVALAEEDDPPRTSVRIKRHPFGLDDGLYESVRKLQDVVLPLESRLVDELARCDLVVALNYSGSGVLNAFRAEKPCVMIWHDELYGIVPPLPYEPLLAGGGPIFSDVEQAVFFVRSLRTNPELMDALTKASATFRKEYLTSPDDSLTDVLRRVTSFGAEGD